MSSACVRRLPPAAPPPPVAPPAAQNAASTQVQAGNGRLVVDVTDGAMAVQRIRMVPTPIEGNAGPHFRLVETPELLCGASPCITEVPVGNVLLGFPVIGDPNALETELVNVGPDTSVYRRTLSVYQDNSGAERVLGIIGTALGGASVTTGIVLLPIGLAKHNDGLTEAGGITLGAGAALLALGIWMIRHDAPTYRPGSSNHFSLR